MGILKLSFDHDHRRAVGRYREFELFPDPFSPSAVLAVGGVVHGNLVAYLNVSLHSNKLG